MEVNEFKRVIVENVVPVVNCGKFPSKRAVNEACKVEADIFTDGHKTLAAVLYFKHVNEKKWHQETFEKLQNDRWKASFIPKKMGQYEFFIEAWVDELASFENDLKKKADAGLDLKEELKIGDKIRSSEQKKEISRSSVYHLEAAREKALFSTWYELFPRSCTDNEKIHGTFLSVKEELNRISRLGFDVLYFPPIHPIGITKRKGKNNALQALENDPGSPWAIGSFEGGHFSIHRKLGTLEEFKLLMKEAEKLGIEIALDIAFQCSLDHPYIKEHPEWFEWRPDGTIQYAENPPKKYEDIVAFHFNLNNAKALFKELTDIVLYWAEQGIKIFRVDNPHTKPFLFWQYLIGKVKSEYPEVIFLSEAFTRPKVMKTLAKMGFDQSYTYFTWRTTKYELIEYMTELVKTNDRNFFRPNFWVNTPDILPQHLQVGSKAAFLSRLLLAATLSSNYGMYGPAFELMISGNAHGKEEYKDSEKYEIKPWKSFKNRPLDDFIALVNRIRKENKALQTTWNIEFYPIQNDFLLAFGKYGESLGEDLLIIINLDFQNAQSGIVELPIEKLHIDPKRPFMVHDLLTDHKYIWSGRFQYVEIRPYEVSGHIFKIMPSLRREENFDYYM